MERGLHHPSNTWSIGHSGKSIKTIQDGNFTTIPSLGDDYIAALLWVGGNMFASHDSSVEMQGEELESWSDLEFIDDTKQR